MKQERITRVYNGKPTYIYPTDEVERIIQEIESGQISVKEAITKYGVSYLTVREWVKTYGKSNTIPGIRTHFKKHQKRQIIIELESGKSTFIELLKKYKISSNTLYNWRQIYSSDIAATNIADDMESKSDSTTQDKSEKRLIKDLKLKVAALETMIDIAEREYNIEIRKKPGTKQ